MKSIFTRRVPRAMEAQAAVDRLRADYEAAEAALSLARETFEEASLDLAEGLPEAPEKHSRAYAQLGAAEDKLRAAELALSTAIKRLEEAKAIEAEASLAKQWADIEALLERRTQLAQKLERALAEEHRLYSELEEATLDILRLWPRGFRKPYGGLSEESVETAFRFGMLKAGFTWAESKPLSGPAPSMQDLIERTNRAVRDAKEAGQDYGRKEVIWQG